MEKMVYQRGHGRASAAPNGSILSDEHHGSSGSAIGPLESNKGLGLPNGAFDRQLFLPAQMTLNTNKGSIMAIADESQANSVAFIVPTLKRPDFLERCLASIEAQTCSATSVLVGIRQDDESSQAVVRDFAARLPVRAVQANGVGVIGSMSSCLAETTQDFVALVDDDVELPPHWLKTMLGHLGEHPDILAVAGRDFLQDHPEERRTEARVLDVGRIHWYGRITGNHHRGAGRPRSVDVLRGSNCLFRGPFLREAGFEQRLRGKGAQVNWELALAFQARRRGSRLFYDPNVEVLHHAAPRFDNDIVHRGGYDKRAVSDMAFNETFVTREHGRGFHRIAAISYQILVGSPACPGLVHFVKHACKKSPHIFERLVVTARGRMEALTQTGPAEFETYHQAHI